MHIPSLLRWSKDAQVVDLKRVAAKFGTQLTIKIRLFESRV
jgi:hypothetical protein